MLAFIVAPSAMGKKVPTMSVNQSSSELASGAAPILVNDSGSSTFLKVLIASLTLKHIALIAVSLLLVNIIYNIFFHPFRHIPGPFLAKFSGLWRNHKQFRGTWHDDILDIHEKFGKVVRIAPDEVSFVDENGLKNLYGHGKKVLKVRTSEGVVDQHGVNIA